MTGAWSSKKKKSFLAETGGLRVMYAGKVMWQQPLGLQSTVPVLSVPDLDGDKVGDVALVMSDNTQVNMAGKFKSYTSEKMWITSFKCFITCADSDGFPLGEDRTSVWFYGGSELHGGS